MKYDSIINLPHYEPKYHKRMSKMQRAAQFNPFSALTGYDDMVKEVSRLVNERIEISEDKKEEINNKNRICIHIPLLKVLRNCNFCLFFEHI